MSELKRVLAIDFGASSGRAIVGEFDGKKITLREVHRFTNDPVNVQGTIYWDVLRLFHEIKQGLSKAQLDGGFDSIGIDTWGVDFGLLDKYGKLLENPIHYRDLRTVGMIEEAAKTISLDKLYDITGIQFMELNTLFQLIALQKNRPHILERTDRLLFMPDLFGYFLTGEKTTEYSIATTSQLVDLKTRDWSAEILDAYQIPKNILGKIVLPGTTLGNLTEEVCNECGVPSVPVISVCGHDTQSAITAVPCPDEDFVFLSSGTWSLFGTELEAPIVNETTRQINITNEGGYNYATGLLKNIIGLWLIQESRRHWARRGEEYSYGDLERLALAAKPFACFIDPDAPEFVPHGDIPGRVQEYCRKTGQYVPQTVGEIMRCIYESLALKYRLTFDKLQTCTGKTYRNIHIIGGGVKDTLLSQLTANACGVTVKAGPIEATVLGNLAVQLMACGAIKDIEEARQVVANSSDLLTYEPREQDAWQKAVEAYAKLVNNG